METSLAISDVDKLLPTVDVLKQMRTVADYMVSAKMLPPGYKDGNDLMVVALRGREMGVPLGQAIQGMFPMKGRIGYMGGFLLSQVRKMLPNSEMRVKESTKERCVLECRRSKESEPESVEFSMEEVNACGYNKMLTDGEWKVKIPWKDPKNMLYWRCVSRAVNRIFSDVFGSPVYQYEELLDAEKLVNVTPAGKAAASVPYETAEKEPPAAVIVDAEVVPPAIVRPVDVPLETQPGVIVPIADTTPVVQEPAKHKIPQETIDALIVQLEKDLKERKTKKEAEELFEVFKEKNIKEFEGKLGIGQLLNTALKSKKARLGELK